VLRIEPSVCCVGMFRVMDFKMSEDLNECLR
jgi:hypothetical protein